MTATATIASHRAAPARNRSRATTGTRGRPNLKVLNQQAIRQRARRRNALLALFVIVLLGFFAVAFIQAQLVADQQDLDVLRTRIAEAENERAKIARDVEIASSPAVIVGRAKELGMVRAYQPVYLEAVAPIQDIPNAALFQPAEPPAFELAAPQVAAASNISVGISTSGAVTTAEATVEVAAPEVDNETAGDTASATVETIPASAATAPTATSTAVVTSLGGLAVTADTRSTGAVAAVTNTPVAAATDTPSVSVSVSVADVSVSVGGGEAAASVSPAGSIAGSRAVTGGPGDG